ncbi:hypothetical protein FLAG1_04776 [Fusarium langsethiae]|uniref:Uncharacterized protein n=1 Tax=Fusarium langsethiae TaxID=179993 RepID=A0A0M9EY86_FUSLA|nr:hypothetical protein FLAG1_04776 [Fusarium langsethiae]
MCYFDQTRWTCGFWRWGHFRQQCNKEYRMGETCGLKLVYETKDERDACKLCHDIEKKQRRYDKMWRDVQRWQREGNRNATIERTCGYKRLASKTTGSQNRLTNGTYPELPEQIMLLCSSLLC